jgi:WS/DGAT/MGAT family acyltransferase
MDAAFLYLETPSSHMHVAAVVVVDPQTEKGRVTVEQLERHVGRRLRALAPFRRRVLEAPLGLAHPVVTEDPEFDLAFHTHRVSLQAPGTIRELATVVGRIVAQPIDRHHPLWELWMIDGLADGHIAFVIKVHHALVDGTSGGQVLGHLFDLDPCVIDDVGDDHVRTTDEPLPHPLSMLASALATMLGQPLRLARAVGATIAALTKLVTDRDLGSLLPKELALPFRAPRTAFSRSLGPERAVAFGKAALDDVVAIKDACGTSLNDVVLTCCTLALRRYLLAQNDLPHTRLVATVPVAVHADGEAGALGNHVSALFIGLPVHLDDPLAQLADIHRATLAAKRAHADIGPTMLQDWVQLAPPRIFAGAARLYSRMKLADVLRPVHNLVVSNVRGAPVPLYAAGARVVSTHLLGPILEGAGINITVVSYCDALDFGIVTCPNSVPDPWRIAERFGEAVRDLKAAALRPECDEDEDTVLRSVRLF